MTKGPSGPLLFATSAYGFSGVGGVMQLRKDEMQMRLIGCSSVDELGPSLVESRAVRTMSVRFPWVPLCPLSMTPSSLHRLEVLFSPSCDGWEGPPAHIRLPRQSCLRASQSNSRVSCASCARNEADDFREEEEYDSVRTFNDHNRRSRLFFVIH